MTVSAQASRCNVMSINSLGCLHTQHIPAWSRCNLVKLLLKLMLIPDLADFSLNNPIVLLRSPNHLKRIQPRGKYITSNEFESHLNNFKHWFNHLEKSFRNLIHWDFSLIYCVYARPEASKGHRQESASCGEKRRIREWTHERLENELNELYIIKV